MANMVQLRNIDRLVQSSDVREIDDIDLAVRGDGKGVWFLGMPLDCAQCIIWVVGGVDAEQEVSPVSVISNSMIFPKIRLTGHHQ